MIILSLYNMLFGRIVQEVKYVDYMFALMKSGTVACIFINICIIVKKYWLYYNVFTKSH